MYINTQLNLSVGMASKVTASKGSARLVKESLLWHKESPKVGTLSCPRTCAQRGPEKGGGLGGPARKGEPLCIAPDARGDCMPSLFVDTARQPLAVCHARGRGRLLDNTQGSYGFQEQHCLLQQILNGLYVCACELVCAHGRVHST